MQTKWWCVEDCSWLMPSYTSFNWHETFYSICNKASWGIAWNILCFWSGNPGMVQVLDSYNLTVVPLSLDRVASGEYPHLLFIFTCLFIFFHSVSLDDSNFMAICSVFRHQLQWWPKAFWRSISCSLQTVWLALGVWLASTLLDIKRFLVHWMSKFHSLKQRYLYVDVLVLTECEGIIFDYSGSCHCLSILTLIMLACRRPENALRGLRWSVTWMLCQVSWHLVPGVNVLLLAQAPSLISSGAQKTGLEFWNHLLSPWFMHWNIYSWQMTKQKLDGMTF